MPLSRFVPHALACATLVATLAGPAHATVLRFDQAFDGSAIIPTGSSGSLPPGYGDRAAGPQVAGPGGFFTYDQLGEGFTPQVMVDLFATAATPTDPRVRVWADGYGSLRNVLFGEGPGIGGAAEIFVRLTADPGYEVDLYGFDLAAFSGGDLTVRAIELWAGSTLLEQRSNVVVEGDLAQGGLTSIAFATPWSAPELLVRLDLGNLAVSVRDNIGLDNLRFGQTPPPPVQPVPAPPVGALLAAAGLAAWVARRRRPLAIMRWPARQAGGR